MIKPRLEYHEKGIDVTLEAEGSREGFDESFQSTATGSVKGQTLRDMGLTALVASVKDCLTFNCFALILAE